MQSSKEKKNHGYIKLDNNVQLAKKTKTKYSDKRSFQPILMDMLPTVLFQLVKNHFVFNSFLTSQKTIKTKRKMSVCNNLIAFTGKLQRDSYQEIMVSKNIHGGQMQILSCEDKVSV